MEADRLTVGPGERAKVRPEWEGGENLDATVCLASDEPTLELVASGNQDGNPALGTAAPDFTLQGLDGETYTLSEQLGRPVFIAYFATW